MPRIGILAYGSLIDDPGQAIHSATAETTRVVTPFRVEFARSSGSRAGAPTLVPVESGGDQVSAALFVLREDVTIERARDILYQRETRSDRPYRPDLSKRDQVWIKESAEVFDGTALYTWIRPNVEPLTAGSLGALAIESAKDPETAARGRDGISYLLDSKRNGIETPLSPAYEAEILRLTKTGDLESALGYARLLRWRDALDAYHYPIDLSKNDVRDSSSPLFEQSLEPGDRAQTIAFEKWFREQAENGLGPWCEVVFWKLDSFKNVARNITERLTNQNESPSRLWKLLQAFLARPDRARFVELARPFVDGKHVATVATFVAFAAPDRFAMVDQKIAEWVNDNREQFNDAEGKAILSPFKPGIVQLRDWPSVEKWNEFCRTYARRLQVAVPIDPPWRPRDVEMAVWQSQASKNAEKKRKLPAAPPKRKFIEIGFPTAAEELADDDEFLTVAPRVMGDFEDALNAAADKLNGWADRVVLYMAVQGAEEFSEILSLCGMGFGLGALKIVRGMYERAVVQRYLALNPDQVDSYLDYNEVNVRKLLNRAKEEFGEDKISKEMRDAFERSYASLDSKFRKQSSWSDLNLLSMARRAGGNLDDMYLLCYLRPTFYAHSTSTSLLNRLKHHAGDEPLFDPTGQREAVQGALSSAVLLTLQMLVTLNHYFTLGFGDRIGKRFAEFGEWAGES